MTESTSRAVLIQQKCDRKLIVVTANSERYVTIDVSDENSATSLKMKFLERVKQDLPEEDTEGQHEVYIFRTEIGDIGFGGESLTDEELLHLCREVADGKGSVKVFLSLHATMEGWIKGFRVDEKD